MPLRQVPVRARGMKQVHYPARCHKKHIKREEKKGAQNNLEGKKVVQWSGMLVYAGGGVNKRYSALSFLLLLFFFFFFFLFFRFVVVVVVVVFLVFFSFLFSFFLFSSSSSSLPHCDEKYQTVRWKIPVSKPYNYVVIGPRNQPSSICNEIQGFPLSKPANEQTKIVNASLKSDDI